MPVSPPEPVEAPAPRIVPVWLPKASTPSSLVTEPGTPRDSASSSAPLETHTTAKSAAVVVSGFGLKGEGKSANYGILIAPPAIVPPAMLPPALQVVGGAASSGGGAGPALDGVPEPIAATSELVEQWVSEGFRKLSNISTKIPPEVGESVLWRGVKIGKSGNPSTKIEYFNGKVRGVDVEEDHEVYIYVD